MAGVIEASQAWTESVPDPLDAWNSGDKAAGDGLRAMAACAVVWEGAQRQMSKLG